MRELAEEAAKRFGEQGSPDGGDYEREAGSDLCIMREVFCDVGLTFCSEPVFFLLFGLFCCWVVGRQARQTGK